MRGLIVDDDENIQCTLRVLLRSETSSSES